MVAARQASVAMQALQYISDRQLEDIGFTRELFVGQVKAVLIAEMGSASAEKTQAVLVNANLVAGV